MCICNHGDNLTMVISVVWGGPVTTRFYIHLKLDEPPWALTPAAFQCAQEPAVPEAGSGHSFCPPTTIPTPVAAFFWASEFDSPLWLQQVSQLLSFFLFFLPFNKQEQGHAMPCKVWSGSFPKRADLFRSQRLRPAAAASAAASATGGAAADVADETKALLEYHRKGNPYLWIGWQHHPNVDIFELWA